MAEKTQTKHFETVVSEQEIFKGSVIRFALREVKLENGKMAKREIVYHNGGAAVLAVDDDNNIYLVRQYRSAFEQEILEIPAGKLEKGEEPFSAAVRELEEETGFKAENITSLGEYWPTVGYCSERIHLYLAENLTSGSTNFDEDEFISLVKIPFDKAYAMCLNGEICDGKTQLAILKAKSYLK